MKKLIYNSRTKRLSTIRRFSAEGDFNKWLKDEFGFDDLYDYFSDLVPPNINKNNYKKLAEKAYKDTSADLIRKAKKAGLNPEGVCDMVFKDSYLR